MNKQYKNEIFRKINKYYNLKERIVKNKYPSKDKVESIIKKIDFRLDSFRDELRFIRESEDGVI